MCGDSEWHGRIEYRCIIDIEVIVIIDRGEISEVLEWVYMLYIKGGFIGGGD